MVNPFRGFGAVFYKETLHVRRDFATLFFSLIIPILQMFLLGFGIDTNVRQINTVVYNADGREQSRELLDCVPPRVKLGLRGAREAAELADEFAHGRARKSLVLGVGDLRRHQT